MEGGISFCQIPTLLFKPSWLKKLKNNMEYILDKMVPHLSYVCTLTSPFTFIFLNEKEESNHSFFKALHSLLFSKSPNKGKHGKKNKLLEKRGGRKCYLKGYQTTSFSSNIIYSLQYPKYIWAVCQECFKKIVHTHIQYRHNIWTQAEQNLHLSHLILQ